MTKQTETIEEVQDSTGAAVERALASASEGLETPPTNRSGYNLATQETARMIIGRQEELTRLIHDDDAEILEVQERRADRFRAYQALQQTLDLLR